MLPFGESTKLLFHARLARNEIMLTCEQLLDKELKLLDRWGLSLR